MRDFRKLDVWHGARAFAVDIYRVTAHFPASERFGLTDQLRRSSVSIMSNIAEGAGRGSRPDYARFLDIALGSTNECECQLILSHDLGFVEDATAATLTDHVDHIRRQLVRLKKRIGVERADV